MPAATSNLDTIKQKVRRLTRSPSVNLLSENDLEQYINTFVIYDFPEILRTFNLRVQFSFYTNPGQDVYPTDIASFGNAANATTNPLYNFQNEYITVHPPVYIAGYSATYLQDRNQFFGIYPITNSISSIGVTGNGAQDSFTGVINSQQSILGPGLSQQINLLQNQVLFSSVDINGNGLAMIDVPLLDAITGMPTIYGNLYRPDALPAAPILISAPYVVGTTIGINPDNYINYRTGQFRVTFDQPPAPGVQINSQTVPSVVTRPMTVLYFQNQFTVRPVPDQPYRIDIEAYKRPTNLLASNQSPELEEYWQYIAYGAAIKIFQDKQDIESVNLVMPEFKRQELLCGRRTLQQYNNDRTATIYTSQTDMTSNYGGGWWSSGSF